MSIKASNNVFPHDPDDNWIQKLDRGGYDGTAQDLKNEIDDLVSPDAVLVKGSIVKTGNSISIAALAFTCRIDQHEYTNPDSYSALITDATEGYHRIDILVFTKFSTIVKIQGIEGLESAQEPETPSGTIKIAFISVFGSEISTPVVTDLTNYYTKAEVDNTFVLKVTGYSLTKNDFTDILKAKLDSITAIFTTELKSSYDAGLAWIVAHSNVDNTSDINKPVSTAQAAADAATLASAQSYAANLITQIINGAPTDGDTLKELNDKIIALQAIVGGTTADGDAIVNTVTELLAVFASFPEGVDISMLIASKVAKTDVYNALDCIISGKVADARTVKVLNDLIVSLTATVTGKEDTYNKTSTIVGNETNVNKYPNTKAVNDADVIILNTSKSYTDSKIVTNYSKIVFVNANDPTTATIFDLANPPVTNDNSLKTDVSNLYVGANNSKWVYKTSPAGYATEPVANNLGTQIATALEKTTINDNDKVGISDVEDSNKTKFWRWSTIKIVLNNLYKTWVLGINSISGITYTIGINDYKTIGVFSNANPVAFTVPTNASVAIPIGTTFEYAVQGAGTVTVGGAGITFIQNNLVFVTGNKFYLTKTGTDEWTVEGSSVTIKATLSSNVYIDLQNGNDATGEFQNLLKPFKTLQAALDVTPTNLGEITFNIYGSGTAYIIKNLSYLFNHNFVAINGANISFANYNTTTYGIVVATNTTATYRFKTIGSVIFGNGTTSFQFTNNYATLDIDCGTFEVKTNSILGNTRDVKIKANNTNLNATTGTIMTCRFPVLSIISLDLGVINHTGTSLNILMFDIAFALVQIKFTSLTSSATSGTPFYIVATNAQVQLGNISMTSFNNTIFVVSNNAIINTEFVTSYSVNNGNLVSGSTTPITLSGGGNFNSGYLAVGSPIILKNGIFRIKYGFANMNNQNFSPNIILVSSTLYIYNYMFNDSSASSFAYSSSPVLTIHGLCKIINGAASGTQLMFGTNMNLKTNINFLINGTLQLERVDYTTGVGSLVTTNTVTSTL